MSYERRESELVIEPDTTIELMTLITPLTLRQATKATAIIERAIIVYHAGRSSIRPTEYATGHCIYATL